MVIAQISDLHVGQRGHLAYGCIDTAACFARCVGHLLRLQPLPEIVVASGDLVDMGAPAEYEILRELLAPLPMPVYLMPGNHDDRTALRAEFGDHSYLFSTHDMLYYAIECQPVRLIMLDTVLPGADGGALGAEQLEWLAMTLAAEPDKPTLIFMHHPPIATGIHYMDEIALAGDDAARLGVIIRKHPQVERIACGHLHRMVEARWNGSVVGICPSAAFQSIPGLARDKFDAAPDEPPAYQLHYWNRTQLVTHTLQVTE
ncbi:MAG: phosphodiesterase [Pseudomonadota bacterium]